MAIFVLSEYRPSTTIPIQVPRSTGRAVNRENEAQQQLDALDQRLDDLRERVAAAGLGDKPVSVLRVSPDGNRSIRVGTSESIAFRALGIAQPEAQTDPEEFRIDVSEENLDVLDGADTLFVYVDDTAEAERERIESSPLWNRLPAVQADRVHFVSSGVWNSADIIGFGNILDDIEEFFIEPGESE
nr:ABC transporter substrate-binding protein [Microbacterium amylolyticum]